METNVYVGRQPILDQRGNIYAYELLYRNSEQNRFPGIDPEKATIGLLVNTFLSIGVDKVSGRNLSFINFSEQLLTQDLIMDLDPKRVVIEIVEDVAITSSLLSRLRTFKKVGFKIALDDFVMENKYARYEELFKLVDFIKVDFMNTPIAERRRIERLAKKYPLLTLLAEKIETKEQFFIAQQLGYKLFQGYYFAKPEIIKDAEIPSNVTLQLHIIDKLNKESPNIDEIAMLIKKDVSLAYKLLRYINSLAFGVPKKIHSIKHAIILIGLRETKKWILVFALHRLGKGMENGRMQALIDYSLTRAKMCELLAKHARKKNADEYFLAGMFSLINVIMKREWDEILPLISLSDEVVQTLTGELTEITPYVQLAIALERFDWNLIHELSMALGINEGLLQQFSIEANLWAQQLD
ncbi:hypothetical protein AU377_05150 [Sporosarcina sp. HYO08]|nr:hypothetical protein AU377_05150 [Sporosarcina sp. HYO08]